MSTQRIRRSTAVVANAAIEMRDSMTREEAILWERLRNRNLGGLKFRAQHPVGRFILDFYCPLLKLAIEIDGSIHNVTVEHDKARDEEIRMFGYRVLHFTNEQVTNEIESVLSEIWQTSQDIQAIAPSAI